MTDLGMVAQPRFKKQSREASRYRGPEKEAQVQLLQLLHRTDRTSVSAKQPDFLREPKDTPVYYAGNLDLLSRRCVSIVGTRDVSEAGAARARRLAKELVTSGIVVVSGLARGIDTAALSSAIEHGGSVAAVIGTPLDKASPQENSTLQSDIFRHHLLLTPFKKGETVYPSNFPKRNRVMAAISDATVIVEASDTSGTLHQAAECQALGRWLFILRTVVENPSVTWPTRFLNNSRTIILDQSSQIVEALADQ